ncbi:MAG: S9 family peptidase [Idiomarina sp.]|nr:S9 family peptidase [Idiomarina sp.]
MFDTSARNRLHQPHAYAFCLLGAGLYLSASSAQANQITLDYQQPDQAIIDIVDAAPSPGGSISPGGAYLLVQQYPALPSIEDLAADEYRLAGIRINPHNFTISQTRYVESLTLVDTQTGDDRLVTGLPDDARIIDTAWAPNADYIAALNMQDDGVTLYRIHVETGAAERWSDVQVNQVWNAGITWQQDSQGVYVMAVTPDKGDAPEASRAPAGPVVTESRGRTAPARTYQDLLQNSHDEALFDYYFSATPAHISDSGEVTYIGREGVFNNFALSPNNEFMLVTELKRPYSFSVPHFRFARTTEVWNSEGDVVHTVVEQALADNLPISFDAVVPERRSIQWRNDAPATLVWAQAADGGDPRQESEYRDVVYQQAAPFADTEVEELVQLRSRFSRFVAAGDNDALVYERLWSSREERVWHIDPSLNREPQQLWERSWQDRYSDPGSPMLSRNQYGLTQLMLDDGYMLLNGAGASDEGDRPFVDRYRLADGSTERLWRSSSPYYERALSVLSRDPLTVLTLREASDKPADFYRRDLTADGDEGLTALTETPHPMPETLGISRELIHYERADGLAMSATLYLPAGYDQERDGPLPAIVWAYPREYRSAADAAQVSGSPYEFNRISYWRPQFLATQGYAVLDNATMPIVGEGDAQPNDTFIEQLILNSEAVIKAGADLGVVDANRVALGGHSYGAFMTANVLAHSDLFKAGIARSGAYNRSLTPFGFQREERTVWDDPQLYLTMSPFFQAHQIKTPLLLIHGAEDNNSGTFPMQSERLYQAVKGLGGTTRLVMLPHESHGYRARESVLHMLWETVNWLDEFVKDAE